MTTYYIINGANGVFSTLKEAKYHIWVAYTAKERVKFLGDTTILKIHNEEAVTYTPVKIDEEGNVTYGKTKKY